MFALSAKMSSFSLLAIPARPLSAIIKKRCDQNDFHPPNLITGSTPIIELLSIKRD
jgi:hypothetical protein